MHIYLNLSKASADRLARIGAKLSTANGGTIAKAIQITEAIIEAVEAGDRAVIIKANGSMVDIIEGEAGQ